MNQLHRQTTTMSPGNCIHSATSNAIKCGLIGEQLSGSVLDCHCTHTHTRNATNAVAKAQAVLIGQFLSHQFLFTYYTNSQKPILGRGFTEEKEERKLDAY